MISRILPLLLAVPVLLALPFLSSLASAQGYQLVWSDEFDSTSVDTGKWTFKIGDGCPSLCGWGNNELQYYRSQNATVSGGLLTITAKEESFGGRSYTSARMVTKNKADWTYGRFEMRAKLPIGQGLWPAFWMLFTDPTYGGWAASGEIDIMEYVGQNADEVLGTIHYGGPFPGNVFTGFDYILPSGTFNDNFHTFALEWEPGELRWYVDGILYACQYDWYSTAGPYPAPFDHDFHLLLNLAVGGNLPGPPDGTTVFPQELVVDYVRAYQKPEFEDCRIVFAGLDHGNPFANNWFSFNGIAGGGIGTTGAIPPVDGCLAGLAAGWGSGGSPGFFGGFGRWNPRDLTDMTHFSFWIDPDAGQDYTLVVQFQDDDNGDDSIPGSPDGADDEFETSITVKPSGGDVTAGGGWQRVSIPLTVLVDDNSYHWGGNGVFDPFSTGGGGNGRLVNMVFSLISNSGADVTFRTDRWEFTREEGGAEGFVWFDLDGNGSRTGGEPGVDNVTVRLLDEFLTELAVTTTDSLGFYSFADLASGELKIEVATAATELDGVAGTVDPDGIGTPDVAWVPIDCSGTVTNLDFGYESTPTGVPDGSGSPGPILQTGVPNPFTASTRITFSLDRAETVSLTVIDATGRRVRELLRREVSAGRHSVTWDGRDGSGRRVASGFYLVVLKAESDFRTSRLLKLR